MIVLVRLLAGLMVVQLVLGYSAGVVWWAVSNKMPGLIILGFVPPFLVFVAYQLGKAMHGDEI